MLVISRRDGKNGIYIGTKTKVILEGLYIFKKIQRSLALEALLLILQSQCVLVCASNVYISEYIYFFVCGFLLVFLLFFYFPFLFSY